MRFRRWIIATLEHPLCTLTHPITNKRPWLWAFPHCPLTRLSGRLDRRWKTDYWTTP